MQPQPVEEGPKTSLLSRLKQVAGRKAVLLGILFTTVILVGSLMLWREVSKSQERNNSALEQLEAQRKQVATANSAPGSQEPHSDVSNLEFTDISDTAFKKPSCERLENRPAIIITSPNCSYKLKALSSVSMAVVFVYEDTYYDYMKNSYASLSNNSYEDTNSLSYFNKYVKTQAKRFKISDPVQLKMKYYGPFKNEESVSGFYYRDQSNEILKIFQKTTADNSVDVENFDLIHYVFLNAEYGGVAYPYLHQAFTYNSVVVPTFIHETLHLFGASDKYNNNDCDTVGTGDPFGRYNGAYPGKDIMCSNFSLESSNINDITAREIGWPN